jgi:uncharacterized membrane protein YdjX (TVP38/TMEM64 family)
MLSGQAADQFDFACPASKQAINQRARRLGEKLPLSFRLVPALSPRSPDQDPHSLKASQESDYGKDALRIAGAVVLVAVLVGMINLPIVRDWLSLSHPEEDPSPVGFFVVATVLCLAMVPRTWICVVAGTFYGAVNGSILSFLSALVAAMIMFIVSRLLLRGPIKRRMPEWMKPWYARLNADGFRWILLIRIAPVGHAMVANILGGVSRMKFTSYVTATAIGFLPETIGYATLGSSLTKMSFTQLLLGAGILAALLASYHFLPIRPENQADRPTSLETKESPIHSTRSVS